MPEDDDIRTTLLDAGGWAERHATLPGPGRARRRARTRSAATVLAAATASVLVVLGTIVGVTVWDGGNPPIPAAPPVIGPPPATPAPTVIGPPVSVDDVDLGAGVQEGPEYTTEPVDGFPLDVCPGEGVPGVDQAVERRFLLTTGPEFGEGRGLLVFADAEAAVAFMSGFEAAADSCANGRARPEGGTREIVREDLPGAWATGTTLLLLDVPDPDGDPQPTVGTYLFAVRTGSAVLLVSRSGENLLFDRPYLVDPDVVAGNREPVDLLAPQLCRWTAAGC